MKLKDIKNFISEKRKNSYLKTSRNRERLPRVEYYIEGKEIDILYAKIQEAFSHEGLTGWEMTFMNSMIKKIENNKNKKIIFTQQQVEPLQQIIKYPLLNLSPEKLKQELKKPLNLYFKKIL